MDIESFKSANPAYKDVPNDVLADKVYDKFYKGKVDKEKYLDSVMPKAGWASTIGNAVMRGGSEVAATGALVEGGLAHAVGANDLSDKLFETHDIIQKQGENYWQPKGRESTGQKVVGGIAEATLPLAAAGGNPALYAGTHAIEETAQEAAKTGMKGDTAAGLAALRAGGTEAAFSMPMAGWFRGAGALNTVKNVAAGGAMQAGVAAGEQGSEAFFLEGQKDDPAAQKKAAEILHEFYPNVAVSAISGAGGAYLDKAIKAVPGAMQKFKDWLKTDGKDTPTAKKAAEQPAPAAPKPQANVPTEEAFAEQPAAPPTVAPVRTPAEKKAKKEKREKQVKKEAEAFHASEPFSSQAGDLNIPAAAEKPAEAAIAPAVEGEKPAPVSVPEEKEPIHHLEEYKDMEGAHPVSTYKRGEPTPVALMRGDMYAGARMHGLTDFDRIALAMTGRGGHAEEGLGSHSGESFQTTTHSQEDLQKWAAEEGINPADMAAYGEHLIEEAKRQHAENVKAGWEGNTLPIFVHGRPEGVKAEHIVAEQAEQKATEIVKNEAPEKPTKEEMGRIRKEIKNLSKVSRLTPYLKNKLNKSLAQELGLTQEQVTGKYKYYFAKEGGWDADDLQKTFRESGWIPKHEGEMADAHGSGQTGDARELALDLVRGELSEKGSAVHPEDIDRIAQRKALEEHLAEVSKIKNPVVRMTAAAGLVAASEAAKADDGSDTDSSDFLLWAGVAIGAGGVYRNRELVNRHITPVLKDFFNSIMGKANVKETGAKDIVDAWQGWLKRSLRGAVKAAEGINKISPKMDLNSLLANHKFVSAVNYVGDLFEQARWKDTNLRGLFLGGAFDHWDSSDAATQKMIDAYHKRFETHDTQGMSKNEVEEMMLDQYPMFRYDAGMGGIHAGLAQGMKLRGEISGQAFVIYAGSALKTIVQGNQIQDLKAMKLPSGTAAMQQYKGEGYVPIGESWGGTLKDLEGWHIHNSLTNDFKLTFKTYEPDSIVRTLGAINLAAKRSNVAASGFHLASLAQGKIGDVVGRMLTGEMPDIDGVGAALKAYHEGGTQVLGSMDALDLGLQHGLMLEAPVEAMAGKQEVYKALDVTKEVLNNTIPFSGTATAGALKEADKWIQKQTWEHAHAGLKIMTFTKEFERQMAKNPGKDLNKIAEEVAFYTNDVFGSLDWRRVGYEMKTKFGRDVAAQLFSGKGQFMMNLGLFAPDWLFATARTWLKARPWKLMNEENQLYARYLVGGLVTLLSIGEALNYSFTDHGMGDNESPKKDKSIWDDIAAKTMVDMGDGRFMQLSKHFTDFPMLGIKGGQEVTNKLGVAPATLFEMVSNKQYLGGKYAPPITYSDDRAYLSKDGLKDLSEFLGKKITPISFQAMLKDGEITQDDLVRAGLGAVGVHVTGYTPEQKAVMSAAEKEKKARETGGD